MADWMKDAVKKKGSLRAAAKRAGQGTMQFAQQNDKGNSKTAKRSRLAEVFAKFRPK